MIGLHKVTNAHCWAPVRDGQTQHQGLRSLQWMNFNQKRHHSRATFVVECRQSEGSPFRPNPIAVGGQQQFCIHIWNVPSNMGLCPRSISHEFQQFQSNTRVAHRSCRLPPRPLHLLQSLHLGLLNHMLLHGLHATCAVLCRCVGVWVMEESLVLQTTYPDTQITTKFYTKLYHLL